MQADVDTLGYRLRCVCSPCLGDHYPSLDDELAVARVMGRMTEYVRSGTSLYSSADGSHDSYLGMLVSESVATGSTVRSDAQASSEAPSVFGSS